MFLGFSGMFALSFFVATCTNLQTSVYAFQQPIPSPSLRQRHPTRASRPSSLQSTLVLNAISQRQTFILDGGELQSFLLHNNIPSAASGGWRNSPQAGCLNLITGTTDDGGRVVGVEKRDDGDTADMLSYESVSVGNSQVYRHTLATIPKGVSDWDALSTAAASVVGIHCAIPKVEAVGGSTDEVFYSGKVCIKKNLDDILSYAVTTRSLTLL